MPKNKGTLKHKAPHKANHGHQAQQVNGLSGAPASSSSSMGGPPPLPVHSPGPPANPFGGPVFGSPIYTNAARSGVALPLPRFDGSAPMETHDMYKDPSGKKPKKAKEPKESTKSKKAKMSHPKQVLKQATVPVKGGFLQRPPEFGPVKITLYRATASHYDKVTPVVRPARVAGFIFPIETTGRPGAPEPHAPFRVGMGKGGKSGPNRGFEHLVEEHDGAHARNTGRVDVEKGHLMALELGGPDIPANIVPQWAKFQGCGAWRQMEVELKARAEQVMAASGGQNALHFELTVHYSPVDESMATLNQLCFPVGFTVTATERRLADGQLVPNGYQQTWIVNQEQDETDNRLAYRNDVTLAIREGFSAAPFLDDDGVAADPAKRREVVTRLLSAEWAALQRPRRSRWSSTPCWRGKSTSTRMFPRRSRTCRTSCRRTPTRRLPTGARC
jgi:hypothetical protein